MRDIYYQSAGNPLQLDRLPATRPEAGLLALPVPFTSGMTQILVTLSTAGLAALAVLFLYHPPGWSWLEPYDLLLAIPILLGGIAAAVSLNRPQWLLHPAVFVAAAVLAFNHRLPWAGHILLVAGSVGLLTYAFGWQWALLTTAAPMPRGRAAELRAAWQPQLVVLAVAAAAITAAPLWFDAVWLKLAAITLPVAALLAPAPEASQISRWQILKQSLYTWLTYDAPNRPGLLQSPFGPSFHRRTVIVFLAVMGAIVLVRWPGSPLPHVITLGLSSHDAVVADLEAGGASRFAQLRFGSLPWGLTFATVILLPVALPWLLVLSCAMPLLWEAARQRELAMAGAGPESGILDVSDSSDETERTSISLGRVVADGSPVLMPRAVFAEHAHGLGDSGSGKTSLFLSPIIEQLAARGDCSVIVLDLKADTLELLATLQAVAERVEREQQRRLPLKFFSNQADKASFAFNPMTQPFWERLDLLTRTDILCGANGLTYGTDYGEGFYSSANAAILQHALKTFPHVNTFVELAECIGEVIVSAKKKDLNPEIRKAGVHVQEVMKRLAACAPLNVTSHTGHPRPVVEQQIDLTQVFREPQLLYFHLSATLSPSGAPEIARLVNYLLLASSTQTKRKVPVFLVIDEFQRIVAANLEYMLQLARSMGVGVILANQSMEDLKKSKTNLIPAIEANCRLRQWFAVSSSDDQRRLMNSSGTSVDYSLGRSVSTRPDGKQSVSNSFKEQVVPRITMNDILLMNDHKFQSVLHLKRGAGYAQYGGMPVIIESAYHISEEEYDRRKSLSWPTHEAAFVPKPRPDDDRDENDGGEPGGPPPGPGNQGPQPPGPVWSEEEIGQPLTEEQHEAIDEIFDKFRETLPEAGSPRRSRS